MSIEIKDSLKKYDKLKRFGAYVSEQIGTAAAEEIGRVDCLNHGDIYTKRDMWEKLDAIANCASIIELRKYNATGEIKVHNANYCHNPVVCPVCADRVSKRRRAIFAVPLGRAVGRFGVNPCCGDWKGEYPAGYTGVYMATATIKDGPDLKERIDTLLDGIKRMRKKGQKRAAGRSLGEWSKVRAGVGNVEIKIGSGSGSWHVHCHFLLFTDKPIDIRIKDSPYEVKLKTDTLFPETIKVSKFNHEWHDATAGEGINFDVQPVTFRENVNGRECKTFSDSVQAQAQEVLKYSTLLSTKKKTGVLNTSQYVELIQRRGTRRLFNAIGLLRCDRRNEESFMTITERELRRLEYVDQMDSKEYTIHSAQWQSGGTYGRFKDCDRAVFGSSDDMNTRFKNLRRQIFQAQTAKYQGEYRKERNAVFKNRYIHKINESFELVLNDLRDVFRNKVSSLWEKFDDSTFIPEYLTDFNSDGVQGVREKSGYASEKHWDKYHQYSGDHHFIPYVEPFYCT